MSLLSADLDNISSFFANLPGHSEPEQSRKLVRRIGPVIRIAAVDYQGDENLPEDDESDEDVLEEELPFGQWEGEE